MEPSSPRKKSSNQTSRKPEPFAIDEISLIGRRLRTSSDVLEALSTIVDSENLSHIRSLSLHGNLITHLEQLASSSSIHWLSLLELDLSSNRLSQVISIGSFFSGCSKTLLSLNLSSNAISSLFPASSSQVFTSLKRLDISFNGLKSLNGIAELAPNLIYLSAEGNSISKISEICQTLKKLSRLEELKLSGPRNSWANPVCLKKDEYRNSCFQTSTSLKFLDGFDKFGNSGHSYWHSTLLDQKLSAYSQENDLQQEKLEEEQSQSQIKKRKKQNPRMLEEAIRALRQSIGLSSPPKQNPQRKISEEEEEESTVLDEEEIYEFQAQQNLQLQTEEEELCEKLKDEVKLEQGKSVSLAKLIVNWASAEMGRRLIPLDKARTKIETQIRHLEVLREQVLIAAQCVKGSLEELRERDILLDKQRREFERFKSRISRDNAIERTRNERTIKDLEIKAKEGEEEILILRKSLSDRDLEIARIAQEADRARESETTASALTSELENVIKSLRSQHKEAITKLRNDLKMTSERENDLETRLLSVTKKLHDLEREKELAEQANKRGSLRIVGEQTEMRRQLEETLQECEEMKILVEDREQKLSKSESEILRLNEIAEKSKRQALEQGERAESLARELDDNDNAFARLRLRMEEMEKEIRERKRRQDILEKERVGNEKKSLESDRRINELEQRLKELETELAEKNDIVSQNELIVRTLQSENTELLSKLSKLTAVFSSISSTTTATTISPSKPRTINNQK